MTSKDIARFIGQKTGLRKMGYCFIHLTTLREWYIFRALRRILKESQSPVTALDAGFGLGQHTYYLARQPQVSRLLAIEQDAELVRDFQSFLQRQGLDQVRLLNGDIQQVEIEGLYDIILCCSVMEHVKDDESLLQRFHAHLSAQGSLLIYVPTSERRVFKHLEKRIAALTKQSGEKMPHGHVRYDQPDEITAKLEKTGFAVKRKEISYGPYGRIAYDTVTSVQYSPFFKVLFPFYVLFVHPFILLLMLVDLHRHNEEGNGLLIVAHKPAAQTT